MRSSDFTMTGRRRTAVKKELRAIKRTVAQIESTFEGVAAILRRAQVAAMAAARPAQHAKLRRAK
jgi:hypothetical protein